MAADFFLGESLVGEGNEVAHIDLVIGSKSGHTVGSPVHRLAPLEKVITGFGARGILFYGYVGCSFAGVHQEIQRDYFQKQGIPSISLEGSFQVGPPSGQLLTRVRAFVEMLS